MVHFEADDRDKEIAGSASRSVAAFRTLNVGGIAEARRFATMVTILQLGSKPTDSGKSGKTKGAQS